MGERTPRQLVAQARRQHLHPELRRRGFRAKGQRSWHRRYDGGGWVVVELVGDKWNTAEHGEWRAEVAAWPAGTWEWQSREFPGELPWAMLPRPVGIEPPEVPVDEAADPTIRLDGDLPDAGLATAAGRLTTWVVGAVERAEALLDPEAAAPRMDPVFTVAAMRAAAPRGAEVLREALDELTARFQRDPRPVALGPTVRAWRAEAGLPDVPLPAWWQVQMLGGAAPRLDSPRRAFASGVGTTEAHTADGGRLPVRGDLLPDADQLERWRADRAAHPVGGGVLEHPPEWLVWSRWLDRPASPPGPAPVASPGSWWRRLLGRT